MTTLAFKQVDVFTNVPFNGNPLAVVLDADGLTLSEMQKIANWTNLSETVFFQSSDTADYQLRIFTPRAELPFAGHPTIGSAHAAREKGLISPERNSIVQECKAGLVPITISDEVFMARVPVARVLEEPLDSSRLRGCIGADGAEPMIIDVGPHWMVARVDSVDTLYSLSIDFADLAQWSQSTGATGLSIYAVDKQQQVHVRSLAPNDGIPEDPVCGSGNAAVAVHVEATEQSEKTGRSYTASQGQALGRDGRVEVRIANNNEIFIGGQAVTVIDGRIRV
jgi:PhzF family phenazine biosynthesis protein